jgi:hypothetical protein
LQLSLEAGESFEIQLQLKTKEFYIFVCTYIMSKVRPKHTFLLLLLMLNIVKRNKNLKGRILLCFLKVLRHIRVSSYFLVANFEKLMAGLTP